MSDTSTSSLSVGVGVGIAVETDVAPELRESPKPITLVPTAYALSMMQTVEQEQVVRLAVVKEALSWVNTPYRQQGYIKGLNGAVDCSMLLVGAYVLSGLVEPFDPRPYPPSWFLHHSEERYLAWMESLSVEVQTPQAGDIVLFKYGRCFAHSGILTDVPGQIVHAAAITGKCTLGDLSDTMLSYIGKESRPRKFFDVWSRLKSVSTSVSMSTGKAD